MAASPAPPDRLVITDEDLPTPGATALSPPNELRAKNPDVVEARRRLVEEGYLDPTTGEATHGTPTLPHADGPFPGTPAWREAQSRSRSTAPRPSGPRFVGDAELAGISVRQGIDSLAYVIAGIAMIAFGVSADGSGWSVVLGIAAILYGGWVLVADSYWVSTLIYLIAIVAVFAAFGAGS